MSIKPLQHSRPPPINPDFLDNSSRSMKAEIVVVETEVCVCQKEREKRNFTVCVETAKELKLENVGLVKGVYATLIVFSKYYRYYGW